MSLPLLDPGGVWLTTYFIGLSLIIVLVGRRLVGRLLPVSAQAFWVYVLLQALFIVEYPRAHFGPYTPSFQSTAAQAFIEALFIPIAAIIFNRAIGYLIPVVAVTTSLFVWLDYPGLMHAPSFNMALAAMCVPAIRSRSIKYFVIATALSHHGSTALAILLAQFVVTVMQSRISRWYFLLAIAACVVSAFVFQNQPWFNSGERIQKWIEYMQFWAGSWKRIVFGSGPGSFVWYSIMTHKYQTGVYLQMHSEFLQVLWESGLIGFGLMTATAVSAVKRVWKDPVLLQGILGCMAFALTYEPWRYFSTALLTAWFFANVLVVEHVDVEFACFARTIKSDH